MLEGAPSFFLAINNNKGVFTERSIVKKMEYRMERKIRSAFGRIKRVSFISIALKEEFSGPVVMLFCLMTISDHVLGAPSLNDLIGCYITACEPKAKKYTLHMAAFKESL